MNIYCCIDGTDNSDSTPVIPACFDFEGSKGLKTSHVKRMTAKGFHKHKYFPGTRDTTTGYSSGYIVEGAFGWIQGCYGEKPDPEKRLFLGGFSRGGAAVIIVAHKLAALGIPVQEMYLFDAVDRSWSMDSSKTAVIPGNVVKAFHAVRDSSAGSRRTFGNCGIAGTGGNLDLVPFNTTHGGVGGWPNGAAKVKPGLGPEDYAYAALGLTAGMIVRKLDPRQKNIHENKAPWPTNLNPAQEKEGMERVWKWMYGRAFSTLAGTSSRAVNPRVGVSKDKVA